MITEKQISLSAGSEVRPEPPIFPTNSVEFVNALAHYYRAEIARMMSWRDRLDRTTNWAIAASAAMLSVSLSSADSHHGVLLFAIVLVFLLLGIESRRYRFFHSYRSRVRLIERNYYARILSPRENIDPRHWMAQLADDLRLPRFSMSLAEAMARRLRRNYCWLFLILLLAWLLKTTSKRLQPRTGGGDLILSTGGFFADASVGVVPGWAVVVGVAVFYSWLLYVMLRYKEETGELGYGEVHV